MGTEQSTAAPLSAREALEREESFALALADDLFADDPRSAILLLG